MPQLLDDIILTGQSHLELLERFDSVLDRLEKAGFRISLGKISLFKQNLKILGLILNEQGIQPDPQKVKSIRDFPSPTNKTQVQRILGMLNYNSDFIKNYASLTEPLLKYVKADAPKRFKLDQEAEHALEQLKKACSNDTLLNFIDSDLPVFLEVDASQTHYAGWAYQVREYTPEDLENLQRRHEEITNMSTEEISQELTKLIEDYVENREIDKKDFSDPMTEEEIKINNPHVNLTTRTKVTKNKVHVVQTNFFFSRKFTTSQALSWNSLFKEVVAITEVCEKRADVLALASHLILLTDCSCAIYLYENHASNAILSR